MPVTLNTTSEESFSIETDMDRKPVILEPYQFISGEIETQIKHLEIYNHQKVLIIQENGESIEISSHFIHLPAYLRPQLDRYLENAFVKLQKLSDGSYKLETSLRLLGGAGKMRGLHKAVIAQDAKKVAKIIENKVEKGKYSIDVLDEYGKTSLIWATSQSSLEIVKLLVEAGADSNYTCASVNGNNSFMLACFYGYLSMVEYLLPLVKDINLKNYSKQSALILACSENSGNLNLVKLLVEAGADVNCTNNQKNTPFMLACSRGYLSIVKYLLPLVKDIDLKNKNGQSALELACIEYQTSIIKFLLKKGAKPEKLPPHCFEKTSEEIKQILEGSMPKALFLKAKEKIGIRGIDGYAEIIKEFDKVIERDPGFAEAYLHRGFLKERLDDYKAALKDYNHLLKINSKEYLSLHMSIGYLKNNLGRYTDAIESFDQAIRNDSNDFNAYQGRGIAKSELGQHIEAIKDLDQALSLYNNLNQSYKFRGKSKQAIGKVAEALQDFKSSLASYSRDIENYILSANAALQLGRCNDALIDAKIILKQNSKLYLPGAHALYGEAALGLGMEKEAKASFKASKKLSINHDAVYFWRARLGFRLGELEQAENDIAEGLKLKAQNVDLHVLQGEVAAKQKKYQKAVEACNEAIKLNPFNVKELIKKRDAYKQQLKFQKDNEQQAEVVKAKKDAHTSSSSSSSDSSSVSESEEHSKSSTGSSSSSNSKEQSGKSETKQSVLQVDLKAAKEIYDQGLARYEAKKYERAIEKYNQAITLHPAYVDVYVSRGITKHALGSYSEAVEDYNQALRIDPTCARAYIKRGVAKEALIDKEGARNDYQEVLKLKKGEYDKKASSALKRLEENLKAQKETSAPLVIQSSDEKNEKKIPSPEPIKIKPVEIDKRQELSSALSNLEQAIKENKISNSDAHKKYKELEPMALQLQSSEFFHARGDFYYEIAEKESDTIRRQTLYSNALFDYQQILSYDPFAEAIPKRIEEIIKQLKSSSSPVMNQGFFAPKKAVSTVSPKPAMLKREDLSVQELEELEKLKAQFKSK